MITLLWVTTRHDLTGAPVQALHVGTLSNGEPFEAACIHDLADWLQEATRIASYESAKCAFNRAERKLAARQSLPAKGRFAPVTVSEGHGG